MSVIKANSSLAHHAFSAARHLGCIRPLVTVLAAIVCVSAAVTVGAHGPIPEQILAISLRIEHEPANAELYLQRGELYRAERAWQEGLADYATAARLDARLDDVDLCRGLLLYDAGRPDEAKAALDRFLARHPDHARGLAARARVLVRLGRGAAAAEDFSKAITHAPAAPPDLYIEEAHALADSGQADRAIGVLNSGLKTLGNIIALQELAIELERRHGRYDAALARLDSVWAGVPRKETWLIQRGDILRDAGRATEARSAYATGLLSIAALPAPQRRARAITTLERHAQASLNALSQSTGPPRK